MNEGSSVERYYTETTSRPPILMLCAMFGGLAVMLLYSVIARASFSADDLILMSLAIVALIIVALVVRQMYLPAIELTETKMVVRNWLKRQEYRFDRIEAMATYSKMYHPKRVAGMSQSAGRIRPIFIDHLLIRTGTGVQHIILPRYSNTKLLASLEARTEVSIRELDDASQSRKWAKGRLDENFD